MKKHILYPIIALFLLFNSCKDEDEIKGFPSLTLLANIDVTEDGVYASAELQDSKIQEILDYGFVHYPVYGEDSEYEYEKNSLGTFNGENTFSTHLENNMLRGREYYIKAYVQTKEYTVYSNRLSFRSKGSKTPVINSFYPDSLYRGDTISITGNYFSMRNSDNLFSFGSQKVNPFSSSDTLLQVIVPGMKNATSVNFKVEVAGNTGVSEKKFTYGLPILYDFSPKYIVPSSEVTLIGRSLSKITRVNSDTYQTANIITKNDSILKFIVSSNASEGAVINFKEIDRDFILDENLRVSMPEITAVYPLTCWIDTILTVKGIGLTQINSFKLGYSSLEIETKSDTLVTLKVIKPFRDGSKLIGEFKENIYSTETFNFISPSISSISQTSALYNDDISIYGDNFFEGLKSSTGELTYVNKNELNLKVSWDLSANDHNIDLYYLIRTSINSYTYIDTLYLNKSEHSFTIPQIEIISVSPSSFSRGDKLTIQCKNIPSNLPDTDVSERRFYIDDFYMAEDSYSNEEFIVHSYAGMYLNSSKPTISIQIGAQKVAYNGTLNFIEPWAFVGEQNDFQDGYKPLVISHNGTAYAIEQNHKLNRYDQTIEQWIEISTAPFDYDDIEDIDEYVAGVGIGDELYFVGVDSYNDRSILYKYSTMNNSWTYIDQYPEITEIYPFAFAINNEIFIGNNTSAYKFNTITNHWSSISNIPNLTEYSNRIPVSFAVNMKGYAAFNVYQSGDNFENVFYRYDTLTDSWSDLGSIPMNIFYETTNAIYGGKVYLAARKDQTLLEFDPNTESFNSLFPSPGYLFYYEYFYMFINEDDIYRGYSDDLYKLDVNDLISF